MHFYWLIFGGLFFLQWNSVDSNITQCANIINEDCWSNYNIPDLYEDVHQKHDRICRDLQDIFSCSSNFEERSTTAAADATFFHCDSSENQEYINKWIQGLELVHYHFCSDTGITNDDILSLYSVFVCTFKKVEKNVTCLMDFSSACVPSFTRLFYFELRKCFNTFNVGSSIREKAIYYSDGYLRYACSYTKENLPLSDDYEFEFEFQVVNAVGALFNKYYISHSLALTALALLLRAFE